MNNKEIRKWYPISSANLINEEGFPISYYDLTEFKDDDMIYVGDDLFAFNKPFDDLREIITSIRADCYEREFEVLTHHPKRLIEFLEFLNTNQYKYFRNLATRHSVGVITAMGEFFDSLENIKLTIHYNNQTYHITLGEAAKGIHYDKIKDVDSLMCQTQEANHKASAIPTSFLKVYKRRWNEIVYKK